MLLNAQPKIVITFTGKAHSGKDTVADMLIEKFKAQGFRTYKTFFAKNLKKSLAKCFDLDLNILFSEEKDKPLVIEVDQATIKRKVQDELHHGTLMSVDVAAIKMGFSTQQTVNIIVHRMLTKIFKEGVSLGGNRYKVTPRQMMQWWGTEAVRQGVIDTAWIDAALWDIDQSQADVVIISDTRFDVEAIQLLKTFNNVCIVKVSRDVDNGVPTHISEKGISDTLVDLIIDNNGTLDDLKVTVDSLHTVLEGVVNGA